MEMCKRHLFTSFINISQLISMAFNEDDISNEMINDVDFSAHVYCELFRYVSFFKSERHSLT